MILLNRVTGYHRQLEPTFRIKGKMSHLIGSLLPVTGQVSKFSQIYIHQSADAQLDTRMTVYSGMNRVMLRELQSILHSINPFVQQFKSASQQEKQQRVAMS